MVELAEVQEFFFKAMLHGWAGDGKPIAVTDMPGFKEFSFQDSKFLLKDRFSSTPESDKSSGTTTIWFQDVPIWNMYYAGWYTKEASGVVKHALRQAYENEVFRGGRGQPCTLTKQMSPDSQEITVRYNNVLRSNGFDQFEGCEDVRNMSHNELCGYHRYHGMILL
ncbi:MAG: hypothetical protein Q8P30_03110 [Candidatus Uhrbacteria bacterium]|nr:hypothetical protein [Candidatus Uhrbacteria bacterium]